MHVGLQEDVAAGLWSKAEKCFEFPTSLRKVFEAAVLSNISKCL